MNKIEEKHYEITPLDASLLDTVEQANDKILDDVRRTQLHAKVTQDIATGFALWTDDNMYCRLGVDELWHKIPEEKTFTTTELYELYINTL